MIRLNCFLLLTFPHQNQPGYPPPGPRAPTVQAGSQPRGANENIQKAGYLLQQ